MKTLILFASRWGSTEQYADWIAEAAGNCEVKALADFDYTDVNNCDKIVVGSRTYMGQISATKFLTTNWGVLSQKPVFLFTVGMIPMDKPDSQKAFLQIPEKIRKELKGHVKLPGKIDLDKISWLDKLIVKAMNPKKLDIMDKSKIQPVVDFIKG